MPDQPNILFIFPDQWRADAMSYLGHPTVLTPHVDSLAAEGTTFTRAQSNCPICIPARACLATGQTPHTVGRYGWGDCVSFEPYRTTLMTCLRDAGYQTMLAGKTHYYPRRIHLGFEQMRLADHAGDYENDYDKWLAAHSQGRLRPSLDVLHGNALITEPWSHDESLHATNWTTEAALEMLDKRDPTRPFFLNLAYHRPHPPFDPPVEYWDRYRDAPLPEAPLGDWARERFDRPAWATDAEQGRLLPAQLDRVRRGYYAAVAHVDAQIGRVLTWLRRRKMINETLILFSSDHGEQLGDHLLFRKSTPMHGSLGVPMVMKPPQSWKAPRGVRCDTPVALHDIMPTLLDAVQVTPPPSVEGRSFAGLTRGEGGFDREVVHAEQAHSPLGPWQCLVDRRMKYVWLVRTGEEMLFDLEADPQELHNRADDPAHRELIVRRRRELAVLLADRPEGISDGTTLIPGKPMPAVARWLQEASAS